MTEIDIERLTTDLAFCVCRRWVMTTKRIPIEQLSGAALNEELTRCRGWKYGMTADLSDYSKRAIVAAHNPSGYVEVPIELLEEM